MLDPLPALTAKEVRGPFAFSPVIPSAPRQMVHIVFEREYRRARFTTGVVREAATHDGFSVPTEVALGSADAPVQRARCAQDSGRDV